MPIKTAGRTIVKITVAIKKTIWPALTILPVRVSPFNVEMPFEGSVIIRAESGDRIYDWHEFYTWDTRDLSYNLSIPLNTISDVYHERRIYPEELKSIHWTCLPTYLSTPLDRTENIFVLDGLPGTERSYLSDKGLNLRRTLFLLAHGQKPTVKYFECIGWTWRIRLLSSVPSISSVKPSRRLVGSIESTFFILLFPSRLLRRSPPSTSVSLFYEKARISLMGSSKRRSRNSRWATSIFLLKINGHADTRKKKKNYSTEFSTILSHVNFVKAIIRHHR